MSENPTPTLSLVVLSYKRKALVLELLHHVVGLSAHFKEIVIVDNGSEEGLKEAVAETRHDVEVIALDENVGTEGRNVGIRHCSSDVVVLLDDDVFGLTGDELSVIRQCFGGSPDLGALCFKVTKAGSEEIINWCHHKPKERFSSESFETNEITEGAVAVHRERFLEAGGFPGSYFISHEGPDLALRLIARGYKILYTPEVSVQHHRSTLGRPSWRRYYFDTRNVIWLAARNYPVWYGARFLFVQLSAMAVYSIRDRFFRYYLKGLFGGLGGLRSRIREREVLDAQKMKYVTSLYSQDEGFWKKAKRNIIKSGVDC